MVADTVARVPLMSSAELKALRHGLRDFYDDYTVTLDEFEIEDWTDYFTADCLYKVTSRENHDRGLPMASMSCDGIDMVRDRVLAIRKTSVIEPRSLRHLVSGVRVRGTEPDGAILVQANFAVFESMAHRDPRIFAVGRYIDRIVQHGESFRFREHLAVYDNYRIYTTLVWPL